ncbi:DegT/DnrJ/EryC1/StrS family aminotransferase [Streptomyces cyaneofuscatus]|uniref:DegT/DnrJ/EryC1/StrS family aminotransferase n=1 Tax=Streptomyces cyaneofuscatus TaxID=66883 RepID=UPI0036603AA7
MTDVSTKREDMIPAEVHGRRLQAMRGEVLRLMDDVVSNGVYHAGPHTERLERDVQETWGGHVVAASSGTMALETAVRALGLGPGDEVIVPTLTFPATAFAVAAAGATTVFADIDPVTRTLTAETVEAALTPRTRAVVPVHMYGLMADMTALSALAQRYAISVIEDCAQAAGATCHGRHAGTFGDFGCFSLWVGKNFGGLGDAGLVLTSDESLLPQVRMLLNLGRDKDRDIHHLRGSRGRIAETDAAVAAHQLPLLPDWINQRRHHAHRYNEAFGDLPLTLPADAEGRPHTYYKYPVTAPTEQDAGRLSEALKNAGVKAEQLYPYRVQEQPAFRDLPFRQTETSAAADLLPRTLCLPIAPEHTTDEIDRVITAVRNSF